MSEEKDLSAALLRGEAARSADNPSAAAEQITYVELDPEIWWRGHDKTALLRGHGIRLQCCVGIAASHLGASDDLIRGVQALWNWDDLDEAPELIRRMEEYGIADGLYPINDTTNYSSDEARVEALNDELAEQDFPLRFFLKGTTPIGIGNEASPDHSAPTRRSEAP